MDIEIGSFNIETQKVWIMIQPLYVFQNNVNQLVKDGFVCYFRFSDPFEFQEGEIINYTEGEIIRDEDNRPKKFLTNDGIELFALNYIKKRLGLSLI